MTKKQLINHFMILCLFVTQSIIVYIVLGQGLHIMLAWNAFLAFIPLVFIFLYHLYGKNKYYKWGLFILWLLFYPNSIYLITDLIYINQESFMQDQGMYQGFIYLKDFKVYLGFLHIFLGAMYGVLTALVSFKYFYHHFDKRMIRISFFIGIPILVSIAVYIGRFLRFNSWDILSPVKVVVGLLNDLSVFSIYYVILFSLIQYIIFGVFMLFSKKLI
ncbi:DUF1361 domain-containing protein [Mycoplasmatota bacterium]|nr:DUF1361 domain-containing protein [Mycoplasmatota bacterium]